MERTFIFDSKDFSVFPGSVFAYWLPKKIVGAFGKDIVQDCCTPKAGVVTGNDPFFVRLWHEISFPQVSFQGKEDYEMYHVFQKGGSFRKWYGNYEYVIKLRDFYDEEKWNPSIRRGDADYYFKKGIGWSQVGGNDKSFRLIENAVCGTATPTIYIQDYNYNYILAFLNTKISLLLLTSFNPTINTLSTDICNLPLIKVNNDVINKDTDENIERCKEDWDSFETSWNFKKHPLI